MKQVQFAGLCLMMLVARGCRSNKEVESSSLCSDDIVQAAHETYAARIRAIRDGTPDPIDEIHPRYWADGIRALDPIKVYIHRTNVVVVQSITNGTEHGKYIYIPVSSHLPVTGTDGFVFSPEPLSGKTHKLRTGVFDFKRTRDKT